MQLTADLICCALVACTFSASVMLQGWISLCNASLTTMKATERETLLCVIILGQELVLARKNRLTVSWYSFLGHEYVFNAVKSHFIALKTLKSHKLFWTLLTEISTWLSQNPSCNYDTTSTIFFNKMDIS